MKHTPGPLPSSCLTCRQRRKKCDKGRPACERCTIGGFNCLGYNHIPVLDISPGVKPSSSRQGSRSTRTPGGREPRSRLRVTSGYREPSYVGTDTSVSEQGERSSPSSSLCTIPLMTYQQVFSAPSAADPQPARHTQTTHSFLLQPNPQPPHALPSPQSRSLPVFGPPPPPKQESTNWGQLQPFTNENLPQPFLRPLSAAGGFYNPTMLFTLAPSICPDPALSGQIIEYILSQYEPLFEWVFFKPSNVQKRLLRDKMIVRLQTSSFTHWSMYLGARIFQLLLKEGKRADLRFLKTCLGRLDNQLSIRSSQEHAPSGLASLLSGGLELVLLRFITADAKGGYSLLRKLAPIFFQITQSDPRLWIHRPNTTRSLSLTHVLASRTYELGRFVFMDIISSLVLAIPPLINYDTSSSYIQPETDPDLGEVHPVEWVHGAPLSLLFNIIKINLWRTKHTPFQPAPDEVWKPIEADAWTWAARPSSTDPSDEPVQRIARLAVQEGWRHALLIYLYMGMCGLASDDERVQASVKQIVRLLSVLQPGLNARTHYFVPSLLASICTPCEKHRNELRNAFAKAEVELPWLLRSMDYTSVIDHLWHGAAANGQPVRWEDYANSRRAALPIE